MPHPIVSEVTFLKKKIYKELQAKVEPRVNGFTSYLAQMPTMHLLP